MKVGLIGYGGMGRHHAKNIAANPALEFAAIVDPDPAAREKASDAHDVATFATADEMLATVPLDGVVIVAPTAFHREHIERAARAGKHVFCEKPLCLHTEDAPAIRDTVERSGVTFGYGLVLRYLAPYQFARELIRSGALGQVMLAHGRYGGHMRGHHYVFAPEIGGGLLNEHTIHMIDIMDHLLGPIQSISASLGRMPENQTEDNAAILMHLEGGVGATLAASGITRWPGVLEITGTEREIAVVGNARLEEMTPQGRQPLPVDPGPDGYAAEVEEWRLAIEQGRTPRTGMREALRTAQLIAAIRQAAASQQTVSVAELPA
jgi:predicted dehydrogenase